jgi:predicted amino acid dehydrogenase
MDAVNKKETFRFRKTIGGITHFAEVSLVLHSNKVPSRNDIFAAPNNKIYPSWLDASIRGVQNAARDLNYTKISIEIESVNGTIIDTQPDTIEVAAYLCMCKLLGKQKTPQPEIKNGRWVVTINNL